MNNSRLSRNRTKASFVPAARVSTFNGAPRIEVYPQRLLH